MERETSLTCESAECHFVNTGVVVRGGGEREIEAADRNQRQTGGKPYIFTARFHNT